MRSGPEATAKTYDSSKMCNVTACKSTITRVKACTLENAG